MQAEKRDSHQIRVWPMLLVCVISFCLTALFILIVYPHNNHELLFYLAYMTVACTVVPLPTPPVAMDYGQRFNPFLVAILGGIGTCISGLIDYSLVTVIFRYEKLAGIKATRTYRYVERIFYKAPFILIIIAAFTPIPFEPVRILACATQYNRFKYALAIFIGRTPRYLILAKLQRTLLIPRIYLYGAVIVLTTIEVARRLLKKFWERQKSE